MNVLQKSLLKSIPNGKPHRLATLEVPINTATGMPWTEYGTAMDIGHGQHESSQIVTIIGGKMGRTRFTEPCIIAVAAV